MAKLDTKKSLRGVSGSDDLAFRHLLGSNVSRNLVQLSEYRLASLVIGRDRQEHEVDVDRQARKLAKEQVESGAALQGESGPSSDIRQDAGHERHSVTEVHASLRS